MGRSLHVSQCLVRATAPRYAAMRQPPAKRDRKVRLFVETACRSETLNYSTVIGVRTASFGEEFAPLLRVLDLHGFVENLAQGLHGLATAFWRHSAAWSS